MITVPPPGDPMAVARHFLETHYVGRDGTDVLLNHRGDFHAWSGTCWPEAEERRIRADVYRWLEDASYWKLSRGSPELVPFEPTRYKVANVLEALQAITHLDAEVAAPAWLDERDWPPVAEVVSMTNGLLHLAARELLAHTPAFYDVHSLPFAYDPDAPTPQRWLGFLSELWPDDQESIDTLAEEFGYILSGDTRHQKLFLKVGPKRSGKGTIGRVLTGLLGAHNTAAPTLSGLTTNFGVSPLIGKPLAIISDARLGTRADGSVAVERLLSISGEDTITIDRKYRDPWTGRLPTRFLILTNEIPKFTDSSGALASRFVMLVLDRSFYGREDLTLTEALLEEAPGIFNWALEGLDRLQDRGHFVQPESARDALRHLEDLSSPVGAFVRDVCVVGPAFEADKDDLFDAWKTWCEEEGRIRARTRNVFFRDLRAAVPGVTPSRTRAGEDRRNLLRGIDLAARHGQRSDENNSSRTRTDPAETLENQLQGTLTIPDRQLPGQGSDTNERPPKPHSHAGGRGWSGINPTDFPTVDGQVGEWLARDGVWRSLEHDPPAIAAEVVDTRSAGDEPAGRSTT